jgi:hypothetical protein
MLKLKTFSAALALFATLTTIAAADPQSDAGVQLDLSGAEVKREEHSQTLIGYTSTQVFYTLPEHQAVVVIRVDNKKDGFPVTGKVYSFAKETNAEDLAKWVNNQHSDGLFPEVPEPEATVDLPAEACRSLEPQPLGQQSINDTTYKSYRVGVKLSGVKINDQFRLKQHTDSVTVHRVVE